MNIYALPGHRVIVTSATAKNGYEAEQRQIEFFLKINFPYTVQETIVESSKTSVYLQEIPTVRFNSVFFEDIDAQTLEQDKKHPDWYVWND